MTVTKSTLLVLSALLLACDVAAQSEWRTDFSNHTVPLDEIVSGGPPKDGIPAIDNPKFVSIGRADDWLDDREPVAVVRLGGEVRAYPLQILIWHEIVNDVVGGEPVTITFCPLCNTTLAFDRRFDGRLLDFGTTGRLRHSDLVMYDRQTETWWQQATGEGIVGEFAGRRLTFVPAPVVSWRDFKETAPEGRVLSRDTGHRRDYGRNPYKGYDTGSGPISSFFRAAIDRRLAAMERIVAIDLDDDPVAVPFEVLAERKVVHTEAGSKKIVVFWAPGTASALDDSQIRSGRDVGATAVFDRVVDGRALTFEPAGDGRFRDTQTGSVWNLAGQAVDGPNVGKELTPIAHGNHFWFAWGVFRPDTKIVTR